MTSAPTQTFNRTDKAEEKEKKSGLSAVQLTAGALAAVSSAVVASFFGVAGTLIGAAVASVISTVSATVYSQSLQGTNERLRRVREHVTHRTPVREATETPETAVLPAHLDPRSEPARRFRIRWPRVAVYAIGVFVLAMGIVTGIELIGQRPVSALVGVAETSRTTTLSALTEASSAKDTTPSSPATPSQGAPQSNAPQSTASQTGGSDPVEPTETAPTTSLPEETGTAEPTGEAPRTPSQPSPPAEQAGPTP
jgi:hypothetical protein